MKIGFDIGASQMRVALLEENDVSHVIRAATPEDPEEAVRIFLQLVKKIGPGRVESAAGGLAAIVQDGVVEFSTNLPHWKGYAFERKLSEALKAPVTLINDAELAALGEATYGAGKGYANVGYLGLGTGVGTALVRDGKIEPHSSDTTVRVTIITLSRGGTLEELLGGRSLHARYGKPPALLDRAVWKELTVMLAEGISNMDRIWTPDVIVLGGSLMNEENGFSLREVHRALPNQSILLLKAYFADSAGLNGARVLGIK